MVGDSGSLVLGRKNINVNVIQEYVYLSPVGLKIYLVVCIRAAYQNINLATQDILRLLESVVGGSLRASLDLIEPRGEVSGGFSLCADRMEVGCSCVLALGKGNELVAGALDDGKRDEVARHYNTSIGGCSSALIGQKEYRGTHFCCVFLIDR